MWNPNSADTNFKLTIQFNKQVSAKVYRQARDTVLLTQGVKVRSEDAKARTMDIDYRRYIEDTLKTIAGVQSTKKIRIAGTDGPSGGCFGPRGRRY